MYVNLILKCLRTITKQNLSQFHNWNSKFIIGKKIEHLSFFSYCTKPSKLEKMRSDLETLKIINQLHEDFEEDISLKNQLEALDSIPRSILQKFSSHKEMVLGRNDFQEVEDAVLEPEEEDIDEFKGLNLERGTLGVFDIEDLVQVLELEKAEDICVISVPPELRYVDHLVVASGRSWRHIVALGFFIRKLYKIKKHVKDPFFVLEGEHANDWLALDMGNIVVHLFLPKTRRIFDLETLWTVGDDPSLDQSDSHQDLIDQHSFYLHDMQPIKSK